MATAPMIAGTRHAESSLSDPSPKRSVAATESVWRWLLCADELEASSRAEALLREEELPELAAEAELELADDVPLPTVRVAPVAVAPVAPPFVLVGALPF